MHIAHTNTKHLTELKPGPTDQTPNHLTIKYQAYLTTCAKYQSEIAAIQKYIPGWQPAFQY